MTKIPYASFATAVFLLLAMVSDVQAENQVKLFKCPATPDDEAAMVALAEDLFDKGVMLSTEKRFELALTYFLCSASMAEHVNTTFNIAQAARFMRNKTRLRLVFKRFIEKHPHSATAAALEKLIAAIDTEIARSD
jgi:hypothetical protein